MFKQRCRFNSTLVQLKGYFYINPYRTKARFNSTLVQLKG